MTRDKVVRCPSRTKQSESNKPRIAKESKDEPISESTTEAQRRDRDTRMSLTYIEIFNKTESQAFLQKADTYQDKPSST